MSPRLTPDPQGHNDVYWCYTMKAASIVRDHTCGSCLTKGINPRAGENRGHKFLAHVYNGDVMNEMMVVAEVIKGTDDAEAEIEILRDAINGFAQQVHQAYHGAQPPDLCDVNHQECPRGLCRSVQHVLDPKRPRGLP